MPQVAQPDLLVELVWDRVGEEAEGGERRAEVVGDRREQLAALDLDGQPLDLPAGEPLDDVAARLRDLVELGVAACVEPLACGTAVDRLQRLLHLFEVARQGAPEGARASAGENGGEGEQEQEQEGA